MTEAKIIYVVTEGKWSDYHIEGVFSSKELAEAFIDVQEAERHRQIEVWPLDGPTDALREYLWPISVCMTRDGTPTRIWKYTDFGYGYRASYERGPIILKGTMEIIVLARDETHAVKIANEKRTQLIALNQWESPK